MKAAVGKFMCPLSVMAGEPHEAQVFIQAGKKESRYWRCECGTMQPLLPTGQALIRRVIKPLTIQERDQVAEGAAVEAAAEAREQAKAVAREQDPITRLFAAILAAVKE